jgi:DNA invertase Pin-like site-specific DNA recombinase
MAALKPRPPFQVLVMSEESRLGREAIETAYALKQIITVGVRVFFYLEDRERTLDSPTDKILLSLTAFADELEREKARQRVTDAMMRKARAGHVTGGRVFGYDNFEVTVEGRRSHVERRINADDAAIVHRIFELCSAGTGYTRIAKRLNEEQARSPRPQQGRPAGWAPSSVYEVLHRPIYRGELVWNRTRKRDKWGQHHASPKPETEWLRRQVPELRIVPEDLWAAAQARLSGIRDRLYAVAGRRHAGRSRDTESRYLLPGFARCTRCGGGLGVMSRSHGKQRAFFYGCVAHHKRGNRVCENSLTLRMETVDDAVLRSLGGDVLRPGVVNAVIAGVLADVKPATRARDLERRRAELASLEAEIHRLTEAIARGGQLAPLLEALHARQARSAALGSDLEMIANPASLQLDRRMIEATVREKLATWRALLTREVSDGRELLRQVLARPLRFTPDGRSYRFEGEAAIGRLLAGTAGSATSVASLTGFAALWNVELAGRIARYA